MSKVHRRFGGAKTSLAAMGMHLNHLNMSFCQSHTRYRQFASLQSLAKDRVLNDYYTVSVSTLYLPA
jgi:hypothetical protein